jgi:hypothetical protein
MDEYYTTVRLSDKGADVRLGRLDFRAFRRDGIETVRGCPIAYMAGARLIYVLNLRNSPWKTGDY